MILKSALFDTNIVIDYASGIKQAQSLIRACPHRYISMITWVEFLVGIPLPRIEQAEIFLKENFEILPIDLETAREAVIIRKNFRMKLPDSMIYGTAKSNSLTLVTRNTKDFNPEWPDIHAPYSL